MRLIIVSNRAPISIIKEEAGNRYVESSGGLASGIRAYVEKLDKSKDSKGNKKEIIWIGWPGAEVENEEETRKEVFERYGTHCVFLSAEMMDKFYQGFCNKTIWPLFHYFPASIVYEKEYWEQYIAVNRIFCNALLAIARPGDLIWIHDYHLMLLPAMVRKKMPSASIGFFLHIPFPSYEIYRLLPNNWRREILEGLYGADLIGFHTHAYQTYFLRSTLRILGLDNNMGEVYFDERLVKVDTFPMGIDYNKFHVAATGKKVQAEKRKLRKNISNHKIILSIDRQDYSKGILNRLKGYDHFLQANPGWQQKVYLMMVVVPSRIGVESYQAIKSNIDELVGSISGKYGNLEWMPIHYQYRSLSFAELVALYNSSDVALITPLRDGMNLIAKEYIASRTDNTGVLILSEMAGAADELSQSIIINPNNIEEISDALLEALEMDKPKQKERLLPMQQRIKTYGVFKWADDFINTLNLAKENQERLSVMKFSDSIRKAMLKEYRDAPLRLLFLDYDGTLVAYKNKPEEASPSKHLLQILKKICDQKNTHLVLITGRSRANMEAWFGNIQLDLAAEHGLFLKEKNNEWQMLKPVRKAWKKKIIPVLSHYVEKLPGSFIEEKEYSVVFHYRNSDPAFAALRVKELIDYLVNFTAYMDVRLLNGNKVLEVRNAGIDKGVAAMHWLTKLKADSRFVISIGDDRTDEDLFRVMPSGAYSIKVGQHPSYAKFNLNTIEEVLHLLKDFGK